jgi:thiamine-phosphate diphosphorylase
VLPVIHAVTTDEIIARPNFLECAAAVMRALGARGAVQLRAPRTSGGRLYEIALALEELQETTGAWLVVTDRVDVALAARARGVQLTSRSMCVADALAVAPALAIGASAHSVAEARAATEARATWLVAGQLSADRPSGDRRGASGPRILRDVVAETRVPVIVIGGVTPDHVRGLRALGVHGIAAIRGIWEATSAEEAARAYVEAYGDGSGAADEP